MSATPHSARVRVAAVLAVGLLPWTVVYTRGFVTLLTSVALVDPATLDATTVVAYLGYTRGEPPSFMFSWVVGTLLYVPTLGSVALSLLDREDERVTAALLVLLGLTQLSVAIGFIQRPTYVAVPVATAACWTVAWLGYRPALGQLVGMGEAR